jgi:mannosyltransferase
VSGLSFIRVKAAPVAERAPHAAPRVLEDARAPARAEIWILGGLIVLGAALRFWRIGHQSYWYDESVTLQLVHLSFTGMLGQLKHLEGTPPVYYCLAWVWTRVFGFSEAGLRSLSAVAGVSMIPMVYVIGSRLASRRMGLVAAALVACNPFLIWYSQDARAYSLMVALATASLLAFVRLVMSAPTGRWFAGWAVAASLTVATHYYGVIAIAPQAAWLMWMYRRDLRMWSAMCGLAAVGVLLLPLALGQAHNTAWIATLPLGPRLAQIPTQFALGIGVPARTWLKILAAAALLVAAGCLALVADSRERRSALLAGALAITGFVLSLMLIPAGVDYVITRNLIVVLVAVIVLVAGGLGARRAGPLGLAAAGVLCAVGIAATVAVAVDWKFQNPDWRKVAAAVGPARPTGAAKAVLLEDNPSLNPLGDYMPGLYAMRWQGPAVQELTVITAVKCGSPDCHVPIAPLDTSLHLPGFQRAGPVRYVNQFAMYRMRAPSPVRLTRPQIERALQGSGLTSYGLFVQPPA